MDVSAIVSGALFDFLGCLTALDPPLSTDAHPSQLVDVLVNWAGRRGLSIDEADVTGWQELLKGDPSGLGDAGCVTVEPVESGGVPPQAQADDYGS